MAESLKAFIDRIMADSQNAQVKESTFSWYLKQIRNLAARGIQDREPDFKKAPSSGGVLQQIRNQATGQFQSRGQQREEVRKDFALETTTGFNMSMVGKMLFYKYDAKTKAKLPYWDQFPIMFPFKVQGNYMLGMNLHYLPPVERARLMYALFSVINSQTLDTNSKLLITYKTLNNSAKFVNFKPCIKKYLAGQIRSRVAIIDPHEWTNVAMMPLANFMKATEFKIWNDSIEIIRKASFNR
jgi:hypothetical protein